MQICISLFLSVILVQLQKVHIKIIPNFHINLSNPCRRRLLQTNRFFIIKKQNYIFYIIYNRLCPAKISNIFYEYKYLYFYYKNTKKSQSAKKICYSAYFCRVKKPQKLPKKRKKA